MKFWSTKKIRLIPVLHGMSLYRHKLLILLDLRICLRVILPLKIIPLWLLCSHSMHISWLFTPLRLSLDLISNYHAMTVSMVFRVKEVEVVRRQREKESCRWRTRARLRSNRSCSTHRQIHFSAIDLEDTNNPHRVDNFWNIQHKIVYSLIAKV